MIEARVCIYVLVNEIGYPKIVNIFFFRIIVVMMRKTIVCALAILFGGAVLAQDWGGHYMMEYLDGESSVATGDLYLVPVGAGQAEFLLTITMKGDGYTIVYDSTDGPVTVAGDEIVWRFPGEGFDYTLTMDLSPEAQEGVPMENTIMLTEHLGEGAPPYPVDLDIAGYYRRDPACFVTPDGYMYRMTGNTCVLAMGGIYSGKVELPKTVFGPFGKVFRVSGIESDAFAYSRHVTQVSIQDAQQRVAPGALTYTEVPYDWSKITMPFFAYPGPARDKFVIPYYDGFERPENIFPWVIFKQSVAPARQCDNTIADENSLAGRVDQDFGRTKGVFYELQVPKEDIAKMFRGYQAIEIEALVADADFVAFHTFPAFGRWKHPEPEKSASAEVEKQVSGMYGREVMYSRRVAWLRNGYGELDMVEFKHKNHQAMVVFAWVNGGEVEATACLTTEIESEFEDSGVWNVDDEGTYGIPDVITIAQDPEGAVTIFLAKNSPESVTCFALHQNGSKLEKIDFDQWYRYVDIL